MESESLRVSKKQAPHSGVSKSTNGSLTTTTTTTTTTTLVSMNVAGCVPSQMAPESWTQKDSIDAVRSEVISHRPDWIALQESPGGVELVDQVFGQQGYKAVGATYSHADQVVLLVKKDIKSKLIPMPGLPVIMAVFDVGDGGGGEPTTAEPHRILVASVHLEPFKQGNRKRAEQMEAIVEKAKSLAIPVVIAGDTNMRPTEDTAMEEDLQLLDVWKLAGSNPSTQFTWDTIDHRNDATENGQEDLDPKEGYFNQYYGQSTRQYTARYDRIYIHHENHSIDLMPTDNGSPVTFGLIGNKPMTSKLDFLSDHFGVVSTLPIQWK
ncbi:unnamed protein product [Cylindrotheca closterium]|uniref:Endonuclease/exonuclease/phosphatase domain-containing protein n=1 Tax=Cylindrotheca closterium TaxID=2856 RepID=A0AAD2CQN4_9STRA|nr:unnamed protein product [Cylindrotheca closterium]